MIIHWFSYLQLICLLISLLFYRYLKRNSIQLFVPLVAIACATEITAANFRSFGWPNNYFVFNIYLLLSTLLKLFLFRKMLHLNKGTWRIFIIVSILLLGYICLNIFFIQGLMIFNNYSLIAICIIDISLSCFVLFQLVFAREEDSDLSKHPYFWINGGLLFFSLGTIVVLGLQPYIRENNLVTNKKILYGVIMPVLNVILYGSWSYSFILCRKWYQS